MRSYIVWADFGHIKMEPLVLVSNFHAEEQTAQLNTQLQIFERLVPRDNERLAIFRHLYSGQIETDFDISEQAYSEEVLQPIEEFLERGLLALKQKHRQKARPSTSLLNSCREMAASLPSNISEMQAQVEKLKSKAFGIAELQFLCQIMPSADVSVQSHLYANMEARLMRLIC